MVKVTALYQTPQWVVGVLFCGVLAWQAVGTWSYGRAAMKPCAGANEPQAMLSAFGINLALWAAFMIVDEVFLAYPIENVHRSVFASQFNYPYRHLDVSGTMSFYIGH
jgi:hypothetical protein